jgi:hypothetical protein
MLTCVLSSGANLLTTAATEFTGLTHRVKGGAAWAELAQLTLKASPYNFQNAALLQA